MRVYVGKILLTAVIFGLFLFTASCDKDENGNNRDKIYELYVKEQDRYPSFAPDGERIVYCHDSYQNPEPVDYPSGLYLIDKNGENRTKVLEGKFISPSWSPDGEWLIFSKLGSLQKCRPNGDDLTTFTGLDDLDEPAFYYPDWSPDGTYIIFDKPFRDQTNPDYTSMYYVKSNFSQPRPLYGMQGIVGRDPEVSPDGKKFLYLDYISNYDLADIFVMDTSGTGKTRLTTGSRDDSDPTWSPTGEYIAWTNDVQIYTMNADGTNQRFLSSGQMPSWSINHELVFAFANPEFTKGVLYVISPDGSNKRQITF